MFHKYSKYYAPINSAIQICKYLYFSKQSLISRIYKSYVSLIPTLLLGVVLSGVFCTGQAAWAQKVKREAVQGTVRTTDGHPAPYISVSLKNTLYGTITDTEGNFSFEAPAGAYTMVVYSIYCHNKEFPVEIEEGRENLFPDITVIENKTQLEEVIVTGQFEPRSMRNSMYKIRAINSEQIVQRGATSMQNLLNTEVGIRLTNDMALGETDFELMGMAGNNVKVLIDGVPMIDRLEKKQSLSQIDINTVERVEIVEGPMSVIYGSDALAGVINIITKKRKADGGKALTAGLRLQEETVGSEYGAFSGKGAHNQSANAQYVFKNGVYTGANFTHNGFGGWQGDSTGRRKQWPSKEQFLTGAQLGYGNNGLNVWYRLDYLNETILTENDVSESNTTSDKEFIVNRYTHQLQLDWRISNRITILPSVSYQDYHRRTRTTTIDLNTGKKQLSLDQGAQDEVAYSAWFGRVMAAWKVTPKLVLQPGAEYQRDEGSGDRIEAGHVITNAAAFLSAEYTPLPWLGIRPGVRSSYNSSYNAPWAIPSLNVKMSLTGSIDFRASYGRGFRAPTLQELYYSFHDSNHNIDGNPDLKAEHSDSYMASLVGRIAHNTNVRLTSTVSGFRNNFTDRITQLESVEKAGYYTYYNIGTFKTQGLMLENNLAWKNLKANLNISYIGRYNILYNNPKYADQEMSMFRYSPEIAADVMYDWKNVATFSLFYKFAGQRHEYRVSDAAIQLYGRDSYHWGEIAVTRRINRYLAVNAGVRNLFNITTVTSSVSGESHGASTGSSVVGSGTAFLVGLTANF